MSAETPEAGAPQTVLLAMIKERLSRLPFVPFRIVTTSGRAYEVPTADHMGLLPKLRMVYIADDGGGQVDIHTLHVSAIESLRPRRAKAA